MAERDWLLFQLRLRSLGAEIRGEVVCPFCNQGLELWFNTQDLSGEPAVPCSQMEVKLPSGGKAVLRPVTANDHEHFASAHGLDTHGQMELALSRTVISMEGACLESLSPEDRAALEQALTSLNPEGVRLTLECDRCKETLIVPFDVCGFSIAELREHSKTLLDDVHMLARVYHWSETEIFRLPLQRRLAYLMRIEAEKDAALVREEFVR